MTQNLKEEISRIVKSKISDLAMKWCPECSCDDEGFGCKVHKFNDDEETLVGTLTDKILSLIEADRKKMLDALWKIAKTDLRLAYEDKGHFCDAKKALQSNISIAKTALVKATADIKEKG